MQQPPPRQKGPTGARSWKLTCSHALALLLVCSACSSVTSVYRRAGYDALAPTAVKRIAVLGWAADPKVAELLADITTDLVKLRKNYLIGRKGQAQGCWSQGCPAGQGVLLIRALDIQPHPGHVALQLTAELYACSDGALLWRTAGATEAKSNDPDLRQLTDVYQRHFADTANTYAAPAFVLLQELLAGLPDPALTDDEVLEKIEQSSIQGDCLRSLALDFS